MTLGQTVREMTAAPEAMKSEHSSMVFSSESFTRFCISYIFIVIIKTLRTANYIVGFLACTYFRIHTCMYMYVYIYIHTYIHIDPLAPIDKRMRLKIEGDFTAK